MRNDNVTLLRDCGASTIPSGDKVVLAAGSRVWITQALGGSLTVRNEMGLFHIDGADADALGASISEMMGSEGSETNAGESLHLTEDLVWDTLRTCYDPEIPVNIVDLGLIYDLSIKNLEAESYEVDIRMTLTAQGCGMGPTIAPDAKAKIEAIPSVKIAHVEIVWDPQWSPHMISEKGRKMLGME